MAKDTETEDGGLLTRIVARDPEALSVLYDRYRGVVMAFALRVLRDRAEAEEAVVDVFHQVWRHAETFDAARGSVAAWLMTLCRSRALDRLRQRVRRQAVERSDDDLSAIPSRGKGPEADAESSLLKRRVVKALSGLSAGQREAIELAYYEGLSHSEVASRLGEPLGTVKTRIRQGMSALRASLSAHEG